jgi:hypothetical protein
MLDFIERYFDVHHLDDGNGAIEALLIAVVVILVAAVAVHIGKRLQA